MVTTISIVTLVKYVYQTLSLIMFTKQRQNTSLYEANTINLDQRRNKPIHEIK